MSAARRKRKSGMNSGRRAAQGRKSAVKPARRAPRNPKRAAPANGKRLRYNPFAGRRRGPASAVGSAYRNLLCDIADKIDVIEKGFAERGGDRAAQPHSIALKDDHALPSAYGGTVLRMLAKCPHWIFAYWEIPDKAMDELRAKAGDGFDSSKIVLRMYDVTSVGFDGSNANHRFDVEVGNVNGSWYVDLWSDGPAYCGEIGIITPDGIFHAAARSNTVHVPRESSSPRRDVIWMEVKDGIEPRPFIVPMADGGLTPFDPSAAGARCYLTRDDIIVYYGRFSGLPELSLYSILSKRLSPEDIRRYFSDDGSGGGRPRAMMSSAAGPGQSVPGGASDILIEGRKAAGGGRCV